MPQIATLPPKLSPQHQVVPSPEQFIPTFSDTDELEYVCRGFVLNEDATIHYKSERGDDITYKFKAGTYMIRLRQIYVTGSVQADNLNPLQPTAILCLL